MNQQLSLIQLGFHAWQLKQWKSNATWIDAFADQQNNNERVTSVGADSIEGP